MSKARLIAKLINSNTDKLVDSVIPELAISRVFTVADVVARDALTVETGDVAKVESLGVLFIFDGSSWLEISGGGGDVDSLISLTKEMDYVYTSVSGGEKTIVQTNDGTQVRYTPGLVSVYYNGLKLIEGEDFSATNGFYIENLNALQTDDVVNVVSYPDGVFYSSELTSFVYTASGGETSVTQDDLSNPVSYSVGFVDVYKNGFKLVSGVDFFATTGNSVTGLNLVDGDVVEVMALPVPSGNQNPATSFVYTASGGETSVTQDDSSNPISYNSDRVNVYRNGFRLIAGDYVATSGSSVEFSPALNSGDVIEVVALPEVSFYDVAEKRHEHVAEDIVDFREEIQNALSTIISAEKDRSFVYSASGGETEFDTDDYDVGFVSVYKNGVKLVPNEDFVALTGKNVTGLTPLITGDVIEVVSHAKGMYFNSQIDSTVFVASGGESTVNHEYVSGYLDVYKNGVKLVSGEDFSALNNSSVTFETTLSVDDVIEFINIPISVSYKQNEKVSVLYTASGGESTVSSLSYEPGFLEVYKNGFRLVDSLDYTASSGSSVVFSTPLENSDSIEFVYLPSVFVYDVASKNHKHLVEDLFDVDLSNLSDGQVIVYDDELGRWVSSNIQLESAKKGVFYENNSVLTEDYSVTVGKNAMSAGPIEIADGVEVTIPDGSVWTIV